MGTTCILVADDNVDNRKTFCDMLSGHARVVEASDGIEALQAAKTHFPSLALIDMNMPRIDGIELCKMIRTIDDLAHIPIIMISGAGTEELRTKAFESGVDDFISKPVSKNELIARIGSKLKWQRQVVGENTSGKFRLGNLVIDEKKMTVTVNEQIIHFTQFEFTLLKFLVENTDRVISRVKILEEIWNLSNVTTRTVDTHMYSLRQKLHDFDHEIQTVHGAGYILKPRA